MTSDRKTRTGHPIQIIDVELNPNRPSKMNLDLVTLNFILNGIRDKRVALISIAGPSRQGKSFLLGFMIRYFGALERDDVGDWISKSNKSKPLHGFAFKNGIERQTVGIWIWSEPFIIKDENGEEIAVLLMDTQGVFDEFTEAREWSAIVGLCLLTSSCLVYNVVNNVQEDVLQTLETFMQYGILSMKDQDAAEKCFQKLIFLIRDWSKPDDCDYGPLGGQKFLDHKLKIHKDLPQFSIRVRQTLKKCFEDIHCYLMPDPGNDAKSNDFKGSLEEMDERFVDSIKAFMETFLSTDRVSPKRIGQNDLRASDLVSYFKRYVKFFNESDSQANPMGIIDATAHATCDALVTKCVKMFSTNVRDKLSSSGLLLPEKLTTMVREETAEAIKMYNGTKKNGSRTIIEKYENLLTQELTNVSNQIKNENDALVADKVCEVQTDLLKMLTKDLDEKIHFILEEELEQILSQKLIELKREFHEVFQEHGNDFVDHNMRKFILKVKPITDQFRFKNTENIKRATHILELAIESSFQKYDEGMNLAVFHMSKVIEDDLMDSLNKTFLGIANKHFHSISEDYSEEFTKVFVGDLGKRMNQKFQDVVKMNSEKRERQENQTRILINDCISEYKNNILLYEGEHFRLNELELHIKHFELKERCIDKFLANCTLTFDTMHPFKDKLSQSINTEYEEAQVNLKKKLQDKMEDHTIEIIDRYRDTMMSVIEQTPICSESVLLGHHDTNVKNAFDSLVFPKFLLPTDSDVIFSKLSAQLEEAYRSIKSEYVQRVQETNKVSEKCIISVTAEYKQIMDLRRPAVFHESGIESLHAESKYYVCTRFCQCSNILSNDALQDHKVKLNSSLDAQYYQIISNDFTARILENQREGEALLSDCFLFYLGKIEDLFEKYQTAEQLQPRCELEKLKCMNEFEGKMKKANLSSDKFNTSLEVRLSEVFTQRLKQLEAASSVLNELQTQTKGNLNGEIPPTKAAVDASHFEYTTQIPSSGMQASTTNLLTNIPGRTFS